MMIETIRVPNVGTTIWAVFQNPATRVPARPTISADSSPRRDSMRSSASTEGRCGRRRGVVSHGRALLRARRTISWVQPAVQPARKHGRIVSVGSRPVGLRGLSVSSPNPAARRLDGTPSRRTASFDMPCPEPSCSSHPRRPSRPLRRCSVPCVVSGFGGALANATGVRDRAPAHEGRSPGLPPGPSWPPSRGSGHRPPAGVRGVGPCDRGRGDG